MNNGTDSNLTIPFIRVSFDISGKNVDPEALTKLTKITPDNTQAPNDPDEISSWSVLSDHRVESNDINQHIAYLLSILLPHKDALLKAAIDGSIGFAILLCYGGKLSGNFTTVANTLSAESINGINKFNASVGFDVILEFENIAGDH